MHTAQSKCRRLSDHFLRSRVRRWQEVIAAGISRRLREMDDATEELIDRGMCANVLDDLWKDRNGNA